MIFFWNTSKTSNTLQNFQSLTASFWFNTLHEIKWNLPWLRKSLFCFPVFLFLFFSYLHFVLASIYSLELTWSPSHSSAICPLTFTGWNVREGEYKWGRGKHEGGVEVRRSEGVVVEVRGGVKKGGSQAIEDSERKEEGCIWGWACSFGFYFRRAIQKQYTHFTFTKNNQLYWKQKQL